jgi:hypothetical protein
VALFDNFEKKDLKTQYILKIYIKEENKERVYKYKIAKDI